MIRSLTLIAALGVSMTACAGTQAGNPPPAADTPPETAMSCQVDDIGSRFVGEVADEKTVERAREASGAKTVRVIPPDTMVTMDHREDRLNIEVDAKNVITKLRCG